ncbi:MAG TPA: CBS domain-containing protein [Acidimicrobiales bacterium]|nr:CBS domain-containing protein [Acidimicrobiales bacterium]
MSPRAAWRLEALGYTRVHDYVAGKADWLAAGCPTEGAGERPERVVDAVTVDVPVCGPGDRTGDVATRLAQCGSPVCVVVNDHGIVQGRLRRHRVDPADDRPAAEAMEPGPATVRADASLPATRQRMRSRNVTSLIVSTPQGELVGVLLDDPAADRPTGGVGPG